MISPPSLTVAITTFNRCECLIRAINSLKQQTNISFTLIVCDDCSTDDTSAYLKNLHLPFPFEYIKTPHNSGGPAIPRNLVIKSCKSTYIAFLDDDDIWAPTKVACLLDILHHGYDILYHPLKLKLQYLPALPISLFTRDISSESIYDFIFSGNALSLSSSVVKLSVFMRYGLFDESPLLAGSEDFDLWIRFKSLDLNFYFMPLFLGTYYCDKPSITTNFRRVTNYRYLLSKYSEYFSSYSIFPHYINKAFLLSPQIHFFKRLTYFRQYFCQARPLSLLITSLQFLCSLFKKQ